MLLRSLSCDYESSAYLLFTLYRSVVYTYILSVSKEDGMGQSVWRLATAWTVGGSNPVEARLFVPVLTGPLNYLASCTKSAVFSGGKTAGVWC